MKLDDPIEVCAAVIEHGSRFLLARRPPGGHLAGFWEFPGGKVDVGESIEDCIRREIQEELGREIRVGGRLAVIEHRYPEKIVRLHFLTCFLNGDEVDCPKAEWEYGWFAAGEIPELNLAPADRRFVETW